MRSQSKQTLPIPAQRALRILGEDIKSARRRRRIPTEIMAKRALITRTTLLKVEKGDPGVSMGIYATIFFILGISDRLADLASLKHDNIGLLLSDEALPKRIRMKVRVPKTLSNSLKLKTTLNNKRKDKKKPSEKDHSTKKFPPRES